MKLTCYALLSPVRKYYTISNTFFHETPVSPIKKPQKNTAKKPRSCDVQKIDWTAQQLKIIEDVECRKSVFITGSAGTGKTLLIQHIIEVLEKIHGRRGVFVTASTGVAACALKGQTLQSFAGVGLAEAVADTLLSRVLSNKWILKRWQQVKALVIDEISMVDGMLFDKLEYIARKVRQECDGPWGGIQLVVSGDFLQLPPIVKKCKNKKFDFEADSWDDSSQSQVELETGPKFTFEADSWADTFQSQVELETVFRQSDADHIRLLQCIRRGEIDSQGINLLKQCCSNEEPDETIMRFFPRIRDVDRVNRTRLRGLEEEIIVYKAFDAGNDNWKLQLDHGMAPAELELSKGARVMLTKNINVKHKLVNGATGTIVDFRKANRADIAKICSRDGDKLLPVVKFDFGDEEVIKPVKWEVMVGDTVVATRLQLPLLLAWAMSIHKSQGMTLERLHTDLSNAFGCGMVYVVLSRLRSLNGLSLSGFDPSKIEAHPKVLEYYKKYFW